MKAIGKFRFVLGIVIVSSIVGFLVSIFLGGILNTSDVVLSNVTEEAISIGMFTVSVFLAFFYASKIKKYTLPAPEIEISLLVGLGLLLVGLINPILLTLSLASTNILALFSVATILMMFKGFIVSVVVSLLSIQLLYRG